MKRALALFAFFALIAVGLLILACVDFYAQDDDWQLRFLWRLAGGVIGLLACRYLARNVNEVTLDVVRAAGEWRVERQMPGGAAEGLTRSEIDAAPITPRHKLVGCLPLRYEASTTAKGPRYRYQPTSSTP